MIVVYRPNHYYLDTLEKPSPHRPQVRKTVATSIPSIGAVNSRHQELHAQLRDLHERRLWTRITLLFGYTKTTIIGVPRDESLGVSLTRLLRHPPPRAVLASVDELIRDIHREWHPGMLHPYRLFRDASAGNTEIVVKLEAVTAVAGFPVAWAVVERGSEDDPRPDQDRQGLYFGYRYLLCPAVIRAEEAAVQTGD